MGYLSESLFVNIYLIPKLVFKLNPLKYSMMTNFEINNSIFCLALFPKTAIPDILVSDLKDKHQYESCPISFHVVAQGVPKPDVQWLHNGKPVKADERIKITEDGNIYKIELTEVKLGDEGTYKAIVKNKLGEKAQQAVLEVSRTYFFY